jgi:apolipoprotein N-acyltransferase
MSDTTLFLVTGALMLAAILIPVPPRGRTMLWVLMLSLIVLMWIGVSIEGYGPLN